MAKNWYNCGTNKQADLLPDAGVRTQKAADRQTHRLARRLAANRQRSYSSAEWFRLAAGWWR